MRVGHKYVSGGHTDVDATPREFAATMAYGGQSYPDEQSFLAAFDARWVSELHAAFAELLDPDRTTLGVGSGEGEHEVLLLRAGFDVVASDVVPGSLDRAAELFGLPAVTFDALDPGPVDCDDVLVGGLDFYFEDPDVIRILKGLRAIVEPDGRIVLALRYRDNLATRVIDGVVLPALAAIQRRRGQTVVRKAHGYRRSVREIGALAQAAGLRVGRVRHAAFGMEWARAAPVPRWVVAADRRVHVLNSAVVLELLPQGAWSPAAAIS